MAKKKGIKPWVWIVGGLAVIAAVVLNVSQKIYVKSTRITIPKVDFAKATVRLIMQIVNNSGVGIPIDAVKGILKYGDDPISGVDLPTSVVLKGNQTTELQLDLIVPYENLSTQVLNMIKTGSFYRSVYFEGHILSKGVLIPLKTNIQLL